MHRGIASALGSAVLFGASTPLAKLLLGSVSPWLLAALLYLGSGVGLAAWIGLASLRGNRGTGMSREDLPWLATAIACGGIAAPVLLMHGLERTDAGTASLLLNLEVVLTAVIAWTLFRENVDRRVLGGMLAIVAGGVLLSWEQQPRAGGYGGPLLVAAACLAWAMDNNVTRKVSVADATTVACAKGVIAGAVNLALALAAGAVLPGVGIVAIAGLLGVFGYGVSLVLFIVALRELGTARTAAYFSVAPFFGAALALALVAQEPSAAFWGAAALMATGVWLHVGERHDHRHRHEATTHSHMHEHDEHHRHAHESPAGDATRHSHPHAHAGLSHSHGHYPDLHHRHGHGDADAASDDRGAETRRSPDQ